MGYALFVDFHPGEQHTGFVLEQAVRNQAARAASDGLEGPRTLCTEVEEVAISKGCLLKAKLPIG